MFTPEQMYAAMVNAFQAKAAQEAASAEAPRFLAQLRPGDQFEISNPRTDLDRGPMNVILKDDEKLMVWNAVHTGTRTFSLKRGGSTVFNPNLEREMWTDSAWDIEVRPTRALLNDPEKLDKVTGQMAAVYEAFFEIQWARYLSGQLPMCTDELWERLNRDLTPEESEDERRVIIDYVRDQGPDFVNALNILAVNGAFTACEADAETAPNAVALFALAHEQFHNEKLDLTDEDIQRILDGPQGL